MCACSCSSSPLLRITSSVKTNTWALPQKHLRERGGGVLFSVILNRNHCEVCVTRTLEKMADWETPGIYLLEDSGRHRTWWYCRYWSLWRLAASRERLDQWNAVSVSFNPCGLTLTYPPPPLLALVVGGQPKTSSSNHWASVFIADCCFW